MEGDEGGLGPGGMNIAHLNVASILGARKFEMLRKQIEMSQFHVFCASETWLTKGTPDDMVSLKGFEVARVDRGWREGESPGEPKKGGGLICYVREGIDMNEFRYSKLNCSNRDLEMQLVSLDMAKMRRMVLINVYRPPQGDYKRACHLISDAIRDANLKDNVEIYLLGDFNINWEDKKSKATKELEVTATIWGLSPQIKGSTRLGISKGNVCSSCIDNIFTNSDNIQRAMILDWNISDHLVVAIKRKRVRIKGRKVEFKGRSYRNYVKETLQEDLVNCEWGEFFETRDPAICWDILEEKIRTSLNKMAPMKSYRVTEVREPWVSNEILEEIKDKDRLMRLAKRTKKGDDLIRARLERNRVGKLVDDAKAEFLIEKQEELADDPKKFWRLVKAIVPSSKNRAAKIILTDKRDGKEVELQENEAADHINEFFCGIGPKLAAGHDEPWVFYGSRAIEKCPRFEADHELVSRLCKEICTTKASGFEDIATKIFKDAFRVLTQQLVYLFNLSFELGVFPDKWKNATIIPLYKGGDKSDVSNYRPVSLLPLPGKLIERVAHAKISEFVEGHGLITDKQGGFRKGFSTVSSIADLVDNILSGVNKGKTALAAFVDLRKAFDTVNHAILLKKLKCYGIDGTNLSWCTNYLKNRSQKTLANGTMSAKGNVSCGVPQGSVLGPMFFILYVNDMQFAVRDANVQLYADDTVIHVSNEDPIRAVAKLQPAMDGFLKWCTANKLTLNASKTKLMVFGTRSKVKKARQVRVYVAGTQLQIVPTYKYLGLTLDSTLSFNCQVKSTLSLVAYKANLLSRIRKFMSEQVALKVYKSMILPYFDYGDAIYNSANKDGLDKLQRVQNRCLKICKNVDRRYNTEELHRRTVMPKLQYRRTAHINNFMFKRLNRIDLRDIRDIRTRAHDAPLFKVPIPKLEAFKRSMVYAGSVQWNSLPADVRNIKSYHAFKAKQKQLMFPG